MVTACRGERQVTRNISHFKRAGVPVDNRQADEEEDVVGEAGEEINDGSGGQEASSHTLHQPEEDDWETRSNSRRERYRLQPNPAPSHRLRDFSCLRHHNE
ncbi:hypothetical protein NDU88_007046 [Pleurodeles waltl]|uniref:Uncharacterized protein n=1 Tax=Pleurodeles waltl TaxID=8319 RepID=A0AAV7N106_PLEWA|nr:hypothetical protein NDU88_007046 [Pleurodeles waltl]